MSTAYKETIYPCPFSKRYSIPRHQAWLLLIAFSIYRFILACLFVILYFSRYGPSLLGTHNPQLYAYTSLTYLILSIIFGVCTYYRNPEYTVQTQCIIFADIILITLLMHACGGIISGIGILLAVTTAAGGLLIGDRCAMLFAALASLAVLTEQVYASQTHAFETTAYTYAGMLGASFFTIAFLSYFLALRTEQTEQIISQLEELNKYIIQHLNSGIIITDQQQQISLMNEAALTLLNLKKTPDDLTNTSEQLVISFRNWLQDSSQDIATLKMGGDININLRFIPMETEHKTFVMITLEDVALYNQRLQQGKLASLGQLTASIAHEIRNPLGALSHAGQLLSESPNLKSQDKRLTEIIHTHTKRVNKIIEDILKLSRRNPSVRKILELGKWLEEYLQNFLDENHLDKKLFAIEIEDNHRAYIDPDHLKQIMDNLCHNALKYGRQENEFIVFKISTIQNSPCIEVIDNGNGIDKKNIDRLFEPFFTTSTTGTGLGLYISRELAELNQAKLSYHSTPTLGSCFRLCLLDADKKVIEI